MPPKNPQPKTTTGYPKKEIEKIIRACNQKNRNRKL